MKKKLQSAKINKIIKFSNVDGPGNRMSIFFQGCNFNCLYCHNPETIDSSTKVKNYTIAELIEEIQKVKGFIRGITVSGGEAILNYEFITELFKEVKKLGLTTFVDTNGSLDLSLERYKRFLEVTDKFMLDIKVWDLEEHKKLVGYSNENVIKNLKFLGEIGKIYEVRTVVVPDLLDNIKTVDEVSKIINKLNSSTKHEEIMYKLIKYRKNGVRKEILNGKLLGIETPREEVMKKLEKIISENSVKKIIII